MIHIAKFYYYYKQSSTGRPIFGMIEFNTSKIDLTVNILYQYTQLGGGYKL